MGLMERTRLRRFKLGPQGRRRLANFKANRRGYVSSWIFSVLFFVSLFAEFIANDKPLIMSFEEELLFPIFKTYNETRFGGEFPDRSGLSRPVCAGAD